MKKKKVTIYVVSHKNLSLDLDKQIYKIIKVGSGLNDDNKLVIKDNTGDNISDKNSNYCELTALYWIWKNDVSSDIVGLTHYRRFFYKNLTSKIFNKKLTEKQLFNVLNKYEIIIPEPMIISEGNVKEQYSNTHYDNDLNVCRDIIKEFDKNYLQSFDKIMNRKYYSQFNMLICNKKIFDSYMEWLFEILFEAEKRIDISTYDDYNKRIFGFLSERLFNVWLDANNYKVKELPVFNTEEKRNIVKIILRRIKYKIWLYLLKKEEQHDK